MAVRRGQLPPRRDRLQHLDRAQAGRPRVVGPPVPPAQPGHPAQVVADPLDVAAGLAQRQRPPPRVQRLRCQPAVIGRQRRRPPAARPAPAARTRRRTATRSHSAPRPAGRRPRRDAAAGGHRRPAQHRLGVAGVVGVVHQPGRVDPGPGRQRGQHLGVQRGPAHRRQRLLHRPAQQLVPEGQAVGWSRPARRGRGTRRPRRPGRRRAAPPPPGTAPPRPGRRPRRAAAGHRAQPGQHQVAHGRRDTLGRAGQHLGDQQRIAAGHLEHLGGRPARAPGQLGDGRRRTAAAGSAGGPARAAGRPGRSAAGGADPTSSSRYVSISSARHRLSRRPRKATMSSVASSAQCRSSSTTTGRACWRGPSRAVEQRVEDVVAPAAGQALAQRRRRPAGRCRAAGRARAG